MYTSCMPSSLQIRDVPDEVHDAVRVRAAQAGKSVSQYLLDVVGDAVRRPTMIDVVKRAEELAALDAGADPADVQRVLRESRDR